MVSAVADRHVRDAGEIVDIIVAEAVAVIVAAEIALIIAVVVVAAQLVSLLPIVGPGCCWYTDITPAGCPI